MEISSGYAFLVGVISEFIATLNAKPKTSLVSAGSITPSSQHRAEE
jgi:hypothetical protein